MTDQVLKIIVLLFLLLALRSVEILKNIHIFDHGKAERKNSYKKNAKSLMHVFYLHLSLAMTGLGIAWEYIGGKEMNKQQACCLMFLMGLTVIGCVLKGFANDELPESFSPFDKAMVFNVTLPNLIGFALICISIWQFGG